MNSELNLRLAAVRIATVAGAYGIEVRERGLSRCAFHADSTPSMSVSPSGKFGADLYNCFGCGAAGDVVGFLSRLVGVDRRTAVKALLRGFAPLGKIVPAPVGPTPGALADVSAYSLDRGERCDYLSLSKLRGISVPALQLAAERGLLRFGVYAQERAWAVVDLKVGSLQFRPLRPGLWFGRHKALSVKGACSRAAVGIDGLADASTIHLVEGGPDLLAAHEVMMTTEGLRPSKEAAVAFLGASIDPSRADCERFEGKDVVIWSHADVPGLESSKRKASLLGPHARSISVFVASDLTPGAKDLNDVVKTADGLGAAMAAMEVSRV